MGIEVILRIGSRREPKSYPQLLGNTMSSRSKTGHAFATTVMECHNGKRGAKRVCAGWLHHQIGIGNNLAMRLAVMTSRFPVPKVDGEQHENFEGLEE